MPLLLAVFLLGVVSGLRTFTALAVLWLMRVHGIWAWILAAAALLEDAGDLHPKAPPRTAGSSLLVRVLAAGFVGFAFARSSGTPIAPAIIAGVIGSLIGAYGGLAVRARAIAAIGNVAAGLLESVAAIAIAVVVVSRL